MKLDISTMSLMVSVSSVLQSFALVFFFFLAGNKYRGIGTYTVGTILSAIGFLTFPIRTTLPDLPDQPFILGLKFLGNVFIPIAQLSYTMGIAKFLNRKIYSFIFIILSAELLMTQFYFVYIKHDFTIRSININLNIIIFHIFAIYYLLHKIEKDCVISSFFISITFLLEIGFLALRSVIIPVTHTKSLLESNSTNIITLWSIFFFDYLRNTGFIMMICQLLYSDLKTLATRDFLTNVLNRRAMKEYLDQEIGRFERSNILFSLILIDVDRFKLINDTYGHDKGDLVLQHLTKTLQDNLRSQDILARWGGEEFLILLPNTDLDNAVLIANRLRTKIEESKVNNGLISYTISSGVGTFKDQQIQSLDHLLIEIDQALYLAKNNGRN
ncbi:MAG TPA: GGDEF domain-containing protein, partial [Allocoleopsis sp.]